MINLDGSPYLLEVTAEQEILSEINALEEKVNLLREQGILSSSTLERFYGKKRFEYVAESNAIEGSTLTVGETELAVLKGVTITGHDPGYIRDAIDLDKALQRLRDFAKDKIPTNIERIKEIHSLILGERPSAGIFRNERVRIRGSNHTPPKTWQEVIDGMEYLEKWSEENLELPALIRATVLHAWLVHIHPFLDGNGRTARAVTTLELIQGGYPPIVIRKKDRVRYLDALGLSDEAGDLSQFFDLVISKAKDSLRALEQAAKEEQGYNPIQERIRKIQLQRLQIWETSVSLLSQIIEHNLNAMVEPVGGRCLIRRFENSLDFDDYIELCAGRSASKTWSFTITVDIPGHSSTSRLAWFGYRSYEMGRHLNDQDNGGPSLFWSVQNPNGYPTWIQDDEASPQYVELTTIQGSGDDWYAKDRGQTIVKKTTTELAKEISASLIDQIQSSRD